jgi:16S rRNA (guanine966-N2)-methyltransferase
MRAKLGEVTTPIKTVAHRVRIIGGLWKRTPLTVVDAPGLRPTPDRVRETLFNWIGPDIKGSACLDLFAGTGALGFEAASRGAAQVTMVEVERRAVAAIEATIAKLKAAQINVWSISATSAIQRFTPNSLDFVFLDPPFGHNWLAQLLPELLSRLKPDGQLYIEAEHPWEQIVQSVPEVAIALTLIKADRAGQVYYHLVRKTQSSNCAEPTN